VRGGWNKIFLDELSAFPESKHDDQVDSLSAAMTMLAQFTGPEATVISRGYSGRARQLARFF
jgi:hypothetical protein